MSRILSPFFRDDVFTESFASQVKRRARARAGFEKQVRDRSANERPATGRQFAWLGKVLLGIIENVDKQRLVETLEGQ